MPNYLQNGCIMLHSYQQHTGTIVYLFAILTGVTRCLMMAFLRIFVMATEVEHIFHVLFVTLFAIDMNSQPFLLDCFLIMELFCFKLIMRYIICKYILQVYGFSFHAFNCLSKNRNSQLCEVLSTKIFFKGLCFCVIPKKSLLESKSQRFSPVSSRSFIVLGLYVRSTIHCQFL